MDCTGKWRSGACARSLIRVEYRADRQRFQSTSSVEIGDVDQERSSIMKTYRIFVDPNLLRFIFLAVIQEAVISSKPSPQSLDSENGQCQTPPTLSVIYITKRYTSCYSSMIQCVNVFNPGQEDMMYFLNLWLVRPIKITSWYALMIWAKIARKKQRSMRCSLTSHSKPSFPANLSCVENASANAMQSIPVGYANIA